MSKQADSDALTATELFDLVHHEYISEGKLRWERMKRWECWTKEGKFADDPTWLPQASPDVTMPDLIPGRPGMTIRPHDGKIMPGQPNEGGAVVVNDRPKINMVTNTEAREIIRTARNMYHDIHAGQHCMHVMAVEITVLSDDKTRTYWISHEVALEEGIE